MTQCQDELEQELLSAAEKQKSAKDTQYILWETLRLLVVHSDGLAPGSKENLLLDVIPKKDFRLWCEATERMADPTLYRSAGSYFPNACLASLLSKYELKGVTGYDPQAKAWERFWRAEQLCRSTNKRIRHYRGREYRLPKHRQYVNWVFHSARRKISRWLGPVDRQSLFDDAHHGPGGCIGVVRPKTTAYFKFAAEDYSVSARCFPLAAEMVGSDEIWSRALNGLEPFVPGPIQPVLDILKARCKRTDYNKVTFVPKTAKTKRSIAVEPLLNVALQLAAGQQIRRALKRHARLDLDDSWMFNQQLALAGSLGFGDIATIDLSMASDTISIELVRELLPPYWFDLLDEIRSEYGLILGKTYRWAKFSSMGNGFTFELETMIFLALVLSVCEYQDEFAGLVTVFGDDIIAPMAICPLLFDLFSYCGFKVNHDKTHTSGRFRESCGADYFEGSEVRPFYLKRELKTNRALMFLRNALLALSQKDCGVGTDVGAVVAFLDSRVPRVLKENLVGPVKTGLLDNYFWTTWDIAQISRFVTYDRDFQAMRNPSLSDVPLRFKGRRLYRYLPFLGGTRTGKADPLGSSADLTPIWEKMDPLSDKGSVRQTEATTLRLRSEVAYSWPPLKRGGCMTV